MATPLPPAIRCARHDDIPALLELEALFPSDRLSRRSLARLLTAPSAAVLVAERDGDILGDLVLLFRARSRRARLYSVIVGPAARGLGIGRRLVEAAQDEALRRNCAWISLEVRADNAAARALYESLGYEVARELPGYYDDGADGLRLQRALAPA